MMDETEYQDELKKAIAAMLAESGLQDSLFAQLLFALIFKSPLSSFLQGKDAPDEDPRDIATPREAAAQTARIGKLLVDKKALPNWEEYKAKHKGEAVNFIDPVVGGFRPITRDMGMHMHPIQHVEKMHAGVDLKARVQGSSPDIVAAADGVVIFAGQKSGYGNTVIIGHADGTYTLYGHLRDTPNEDLIGSEITQGTKIGVMGMSGGADGIHLHYELRKDNQPLVPRITSVGALVTGVGVDGQSDKIVAAPSPAPVTAAAPAIAKRVENPVHAAAGHAVAKLTTSVKVAEHPAQTPPTGLAYAVDQVQKAAHNAASSVISGAKWLGIA